MVGYGPGHNCPLGCSLIETDQTRYYYDQVHLTDHFFGHRQRRAGPLTGMMSP